jgi:hypothetical protein
VRSPPENGNGGRSQFGTSSPPFIRVYGNAVEVLKVCATDPYIKKLEMQEMVRDINARLKILKSPNRTTPNRPSPRSPAAPVVVPASTSPPASFKSPPGYTSPPESPSATKTPTILRRQIFYLLTRKRPSPHKKSPSPPKKSPSPPKKNPSPPKKSPRRSGRTSKPPTRY